MSNRHQDGSAGDANYGVIGTNYRRYRQPDSHIAGFILEALGDARTVLNVGAGAGAIAGSVIPGIGTGAGAAVGAGVGGLIGSIIGTQTYYRDTRGYCYYVDQIGHTHYDYRVRC